MTNLFRHQIRFENRSKEPLKFSGDKLDEPFRVDSRPSTIKSKDIRFDWTAFFDSLIESSSSISESKIDLSGLSDDDFVELDHD